VKKESRGHNPQVAWGAECEPAERATALSPISWAHAPSGFYSWGLRPRLYSVTCFAGSG
jgi:hypothetical protein